MPSTPEAYIHRIGRTGRATHNGDAITLVTGKDKKMVRSINQTIGAKIEQRVLPTFDYESPDFNSAARVQCKRKPKRKIPA
jgi:ATP-dependent RNA helicase RhlE